MKIRTKLLTAVLASATALSCALTASAFTTNPKLTLQNESSPLSLKNSTTSEVVELTLKASDFTQVKGAKITVELPAGMTFNNITVTDTDTDDTWTLSENVNYKIVDDKKIVLVDVFNFDDGNTVSGLNLKLKFNVVEGLVGEYPIKVTGDFADNAAEKVYTLTPTANLVINKDETSAANLDALNKIANADNYFIPYGGAYIAATSEKAEKILSKKFDGTFLSDDTGSKIEITKFKLPAGESVTTFGVSIGKENISPYANKAIQFGTYVNDVKCDYNYGTLFIAPTDTATFDDAVNYYKGKPEYQTEAAIFARFIEILEINNAAPNTLHTIKFNNKSQSIKVAYVKQYNYMWKNSDKGVTCQKLQYAVRYPISEGNEGTVYTAIGYSCNKYTGIYDFSKEIKSSSYQQVVNMLAQ